MRMKAGRAATAGGAAAATPATAKPVGGTWRHVSACAGTRGARIAGSQSAVARRCSAGCMGLGSALCPPSLSRGLPRGRARSGEGPGPHRRVRGLAEAAVGLLLLARGVQLPAAQAARVHQPGAPAGRQHQGFPCPPRVSAQRRPHARAARHAAPLTAKLFMSQIASSPIHVCFTCRAPRAGRAPRRLRLGTASTRSPRGRSPRSAAARPACVALRHRGRVVAGRQGAVSNGMFSSCINACVCGAVRVACHGGGSAHSRRRRRGGSEARARGPPSRVVDGNLPCMAAASGERLAGWEKRRSVATVAS
jgi:hypothetical protein